MSDIDRILALEQQIKDQADYLDALANAVGAVMVAGRREALEARLAESSPARLGGFPLDSGIVPAGQSEPGFANVLADNSVTSPTIAPGAINSVTPFASTIRPVVVVSSLPALPSASYPTGSVVVLTTDGKLYRNNGGTWTAAVGSVDGGIESVGALPGLPSATYPEGAVVFLTTDDKLYRSTGSSWTAAVPTTDLSGQITTTQITDSAVTTPKVAANAITANEIAANAVTADKITAGAVTTAKLAAGAVTANEIAANAVTAAKIAADTITAGQIAVGAIGADEIAANAVTADKIAAGNVTAVKIAAGAVTAEKLLVGNAGSHIPLTNPDFEAGSLVGWGILGNCFIEAANGGGHVGFQGSYRVAINKLSTDTFALIEHPAVPARAGEYVMLSALMKAAGATITARLQTVALDASAAEIGYPQSDVSVSTAATARYSAKIGPLPANTVAIKARIFNITDGTWLLVDDIVLSRAVEAITEDGNVLINSSGIAVTNGKITVTNAGSTVIIDGTSNMFKIAATGTQSQGASPGVSNTASVTLTALGTFTTPPMFLAMMFHNLSSNTNRFANPLFIVTDGYDALTSGGADNQASIALLGRVISYVNLDGSSQLVVNLNTWARGTSGFTGSSRYYVLVEAGI